MSNQKDERVNEALRMFDSQLNELDQLVQSSTNHNSSDLEGWINKLNEMEDDMSDLEIEVELSKEQQAEVQLNMDAISEFRAKLREEMNLIKHSPSAAEGSAGESTSTRDVDESLSAGVASVAGKEESIDRQLFEISRLRNTLLREMNAPDNSSPSVEQVQEWKQRYDDLIDRLNLLAENKDSKNFSSDVRKIQSEQTNIQEKIGDKINSLLQANAGLDKGKGKAEPKTMEKLSPDDALREMKSLLQEAQDAQNTADGQKIKTQNQGKVMAMISNVVGEKDIAFLEGFKDVLRGFTAIGAEARVAESAAASSSASKGKDLPPAGRKALLDQITAKSKGSVVITVKPKPTATAAFKSPLSQVQRIATQNNFEWCYPGGVKTPRSANENTLILSKAGSEDLFVKSSKSGVMELDGPSDMSTAVLDGWCKDMHCQTTDLEIRFNGVNQNTRPGTDKGDKAWEKLTEFTNKGFYVEDFPIDNFKGQSNYQEIKDRYDGLKAEVESTTDKGMRM